MPPHPSLTLPPLLPQKQIYTHLKTLARWLKLLPKAYIVKGIGSRNRTGIKEDPITSFAFFIVLVTKYRLK